MTSFSLHHHLCPVSSCILQRWISWRSDAQAVEFYSAFLLFIPGCLSVASGLSVISMPWRWVWHTLLALLVQLLGSFSVPPLSLLPSQNRGCWRFWSWAFQSPWSGTEGRILIFDHFKVSSSVSGCHFLPESKLKLEDKGAASMPKSFNFFPKTIKYIELGILGHTQDIIYKG